MKQTTQPTKALECLRKSVTDIATPQGQSASLSASSTIVPTLCVLGDHGSCCLICAPSVSRGGGGGMWGIFRRPLRRAIWNTPGFNAVLTVCLKFSSVLDGACVACCLVLLTGSYHQQLARHISPTYCSNDEKKREWKFMHFDVLISKMQEFALNKTICWRNCPFTSKRSHFTLCLYGLSPVWR